jgi:hypothetical protein
MSSFQDRSIPAPSGRVWRPGLVGVVLVSLLVWCVSLAPSAWAADPATVVAPPKVRIEWHLPAQFTYAQPVLYHVTVCNDGGDATFRTNGTLGGEGLGEGTSTLNAAQCVNLGFMNPPTPTVTDQIIDKNNQVCIWDFAELTNAAGKDTYSDTRCVPVARPG